jgi:hypothetical protein
MIRGGRPTINQHGRLLFRKRGGSFPHRVALRLLDPSKSSCGHIVLHHGAFLELVHNMVRMIGIGYIWMLLEVISGQPCLALDLALGGGDELLIRVANVLVIVTLVVASGDYNSLGSLLQPPPVTSSAPFCALVGCLGWCPPTAVGSCLPTALGENGADLLLTRGMPSGDVERLLHGLWLVTAKLVH